MFLIKQTLSLANCSRNINSVEMTCSIIFHTLVLAIRTGKILEGVHMMIIPSKSFSKLLLVKY